MTKKNTSGFDWFPTYTTAVQQLPDRLSKMQLVYAFWQYGEFGIEPEFIVHHTDDNGMDYISPLCPLFAAQGIFEANRVNLDNSRKHHEDGAKGAEHGRKGGRPRKGETAEEAYARRMAEAADAYEPTQVPDDPYDYTLENYVPPFPSALDIDISADLA